MTTNYTTENNPTFSNASFINETRGINVTEMPLIPGLGGHLSQSVLDYYTKEEQYRIAISIIYLVVGSVGNILVMYILIKRWFDKVINVYEKILLSLAFCDLFNLWANCYFSNLFAMQNQYNIGWFGCKVILPTIEAFDPMALSLLGLVAFVRRRAIVTPMAQKFTDQKLAVIVAIIWSACLSASMTLPILYTDLIDVGANRLYCYYNPPEKVQLISSYVQFAFLVLTTCLMWLLYWQVKGKLFESLQVLSEGSSRVYAQRKKENNQAMKMIFAVSAFFSFSCPQYNLLSMLFSHFPKIFSKFWFLILFDISYYVRLLNCIINCFVYCIFMKNYRRIIVSLFICQSCRSVSQPSMKQENRTEKPIQKKRNPVGITNKASTAKSNCESGSAPSL